MTIATLSRSGYSEALSNKNKTGASWLKNADSSGTLREYDPNQSNTGIIHWIGTAGLVNSYSNPVSSLVTVTINSGYSYGVASSYFDKNLGLGLQAGSLSGTNPSNNSFTFRFLSHQVKLIGYTLTQAGTVNSNEVCVVTSPRTWQIQGSTDNTNWTTLDTKTNNSAIFLPGIATYFKASNPTANFYSYLRLLITGITVNETYPYLLNLGEIEFYGVVKSN